MSGRALRRLGVVEVRISKPAADHLPGLGVDGEVEIACHDVAPDVTEDQLLGCAWDELSGVVVPYSDTDYHRLQREVASFDWPSVFPPGSLVRSRDGRTLGVVVEIADSGDEGLPRYELYVDGATDGELSGLGVWDPWTAVPANDAASRAEAHRLGLLRPGDESA